MVGIALLVTVELRHSGHTACRRRGGRARFTLAYGTFLPGNYGFT